MALNDGQDILLDHKIITFFTGDNALVSLRLFWLERHLKPLLLFLLFYIILEFCLYYTISYRQINRLQDRNYQEYAAKLRLIEVY